MCHVCCRYEDRRYLLHKPLLYWLPRAVVRASEERTCDPRTYNSKDSGGITVVRAGEDFGQTCACMQQVCCRCEDHRCSMCIVGTKLAVCVVVVRVGTAICVVVVGVVGTRIAMCVVCSMCVVGARIAGAFARIWASQCYRGTSLIRKRLPLGPCGRPIPGAPRRS